MVNLIESYCLGATEKIEVTKIVTTKGDCFRFLGRLDKFEAERQVGVLLGNSNKLSKHRNN